MRVLRALAVVVLIAVWCGTARAEIVAAPTLEWLADTCPHIGVCSSAKITWSESDRIPVATIRGRWTRQLRGTFPDEFTIDHPVRDAASPPAKTYAQDGDEFLIFARVTSKGEVVQVHAINLSRPMTRTIRQTAFRPDFTVLTDASAILSVVESRIRRHPPRFHEWGVVPKQAWMDVPDSSAAWDALFRRSSCYLIVPDDLVHISKRHWREDSFQKLQDWNVCWWSCWLVGGFVCGVGGWVWCSSVGVMFTEDCD